MMRSIALVIASLVYSTTALDVEVVSYECDPNLYVTADFQVRCGGTKRCTFGTSTAEVSGTLYYNKVYQTGIENNVGYLSTDVELLTLRYNFNEMLPIPLCSEYLQGSEYNSDECPGDGSYDFNILYKLPSAGAQSTSWLASGWDGSGVFRIYAEENENMLIGECTFAMKTFVTANEEAGFFQTPSAAATVGIVLGALAALALICVFCYCCIKNRKKRVTEEGSKSMLSLSPADISTIFKRLDEESKMTRAETATMATSPYSLAPPQTVTVMPSNPASLGASATVANPSPVATAVERRSNEANNRPPPMKLTEKFFFRKKKKADEGRSSVSEMAL